VRQAFLLGYQNHRDDPIFETRLYECRLVPCSKSKKSVALAIGKKSKRIKAERPRRWLTLDGAVIHSIMSRL
jgi:hypothetical protein